MPIRTLYASSIVTKSHQILSMTLLTSNNQSLVIDKTMSMVQLDTKNLRYYFDSIYYQVLLVHFNLRADFENCVD